MNRVRCRTCALRSPFSVKTSMADSGLLSCILLIAALHWHRINGSPTYRQPLKFAELEHLMNLHRANEARRSAGPGTKWQVAQSQTLPPLGIPAAGPPPPPPHPVVVPLWPLHGPPPLGQVAGIAVGLNGLPVVFHRGARVFDSKSFTDKHEFARVNEGPIPEDTILTLDPDNGDVLAGWGRDLFYMPHSITIDSRGNTWLTDVALHQVLKFPPEATRPSLTLGKKFQPGSSTEHLCMPTDVAVANTGELFVSDGYCNSRLLKFASDGRLLSVFPHKDAGVSLVVPHSVALLERLDIVCIADRENQRVVCPSAGLRASPEREPLIIEGRDLGRMFAIVPLGDLILAINGPTNENTPVQGFTLDPPTESIIDTWGPPEGLHNPHSLAVSPNATALYVSEIGPNRVWKFIMTQPQEIM